MVMEKRKCSKCNEWKLLSEFHKNKGKKYGLSYECKKCKNDYKKKRRKTEEGLLSNMYDAQKRRSRIKGYHHPYYTKKEFIIWCKSQKLWYNLFKNWKESGYNKDFVPSIDRINNYKGYSFDNIRLTTWKENNEKGRKDIKEGRNNKRCRAVLQYTLDGNFIKEYYSIMQAYRDTGVNDRNICSCCKGISRYSHAGGFVWRYKN